MKLREEEEKRNNELKSELEPLEEKIEKLNEIKMSIR